MEDESKIPERVRHNASVRCKLKSCMGEPKEKIAATQFIGDICKRCFAVYDYVPLNNTEEKKAKERNDKKIKEGIIKDEVKKKDKKKANEKGQLGFELE